MAQASANNRWEIEGQSLAAVMAEGLHRLVVREARGGEGEPSFRLVFTGEGATPAEALQAAMRDIREQCLDQRAAPVEIETSGVMSTDDGTRIWGAVTAIAETPETQRHHREPKVTIREGEGERWVLTMD